MSPPIFNPDGSEVSEIVLPDGSTASEVIGPDGNVVFEAGPDIPDSVVDNFDAALYEDQGKTLSDYYSTAGGTWNRTQSNAQQGNYAVEITSRSGYSDSIYSQEGDGLPRYPAEGEKVGFLLNYNSNSCGILTNVESGADPNGYGFHLDSTSGEIVISDVDMGDEDTVINIKSTSVSREWVWCEADPPTSSDNSIDFEIYGLNADLTRGSLLDSISANDASYVGERGIGVTHRRDSGTGVIADWIRII